jgi:hypothetical protein
MENIARQAMLMKYILNSINTSSNDEKKCIELFFNRYTKLFVIKKLKN